MLVTSVQKLQQPALDQDAENDAEKNRPNQNDGQTVGKKLKGAALGIVDPQADEIRGQIGAKE